ncbi:MAG TPA: hypothetical protein VFB21_20950 [Chthonomonadaceae bacterium]|nr:hypothetical protein [Chthonomonadaceae bacterium]
MRLRTVCALWLPLAVSFELMMLEGPAVQGAIGRLPDPALNLAAWGLTMSLALLVESPVIMLLATAIALVKDGDSFQALRRFVLRVAFLCTAVTGLVAFTPLFDAVTGRVMGQPAPIMQAARPALQIMLFWTAAIAWRRFHQGVLVRHGQTRRVSWGTAIRLAVTVVTAFGLARWGRLPGAQIGAITLMVAVVTEAIATTGFALPILRRDVLPLPSPPGETLTQRAIWQFHAPLAFTTLLTLLAQPMTSAALARLPDPKATLAAWPVVYTVLLVLRGWGLALQEITVSLARAPEARPALRQFTWLVGGATSGVTALIAATPLLGLYLHEIVRMPADLQSYTRIGIGIGVFLPLVTALGSWARGLLVAGGATKAAYQGMGLNLLTHATLLTLGVLLRLPGMSVAAGAFTLASVVEYAYLVRCAALLHAPLETVPVTAK